METLEQQVARLRDRAKESSFGFMSLDDLVIEERHAEHIPASARMVSDMAQALAVQMSALWDAVDLLVANRK